MNARPSSPCRRRATRGFTLLEIMVTLAVVGLAMTMVLQNREMALVNSYQARWANLARSLARELLSELEFHELEQYNGRWDKYPFIEYEIEVDEEDLLTGEDEDDEETDINNKFSSDEDEDGATGSQGKGGQNGPSDLVDPNEEEEEDEFKVRRVKLTIRYPDMRTQNGEGKPLELVIETIFPALPENENESTNPFSNASKNKGR